MNLLLGLFSAVTYGLSDFVGGVASRRASVWSVALTAQVSGMGAVLVAATVLGGDPTLADLAWALLAGVGNGLGTSFLYRGLSAGRMGVVAPVSGVGAAVLPVLAGVVGGERPSTWVWSGIVVALPGIWLVSRQPGSADAAGSGPVAGLGDGLLAGLGFGVLLSGLGQIHRAAGLWPLALNQAVGVLVIVSLATLLRETWLPRGEPRGAGVACGLLASVATGTFMYATQQGELTVISILTSLYPAFTILLASLVLHERIHRLQSVGLALCAAAVTLVAAG